jgi:hypothetical protein
VIRLAVITGLATLAAGLPYRLPRAVVALRTWLFARVNGAEGIVISGDLVDASRFVEVYSQPAAGGRSRGAALSDLFWYWLCPGAEVHQEHLERGPRYDDVARRTGRILAMPTPAAERLAVESVRVALPPRAGLVRLRDVLMPVWVERDGRRGTHHRPACPRHPHGVARAAPAALRELLRHPREHAEPIRKKVACPVSP